MTLERSVARGIHRVEDAFVNCYIVEDEDGLCVVDAAHPRSWGALLDALGQLGRSVEEVRALVLTHAHFDHVGFAERLRSDHGVPVWVHEADEPLARSPWSYRHERSRLRYLNPSFLRNFAAMGARGALFVPGVEELRTYVAGATLDVPGRPRVVHVPGHTDGECALHYPDRDAVIVGDAIVTYDPYTGERGPRIVAGAATRSSEQALRSLDALATLKDAGTVLTGHGPAWHDGIAAAVERARAQGPA